MNNTTNTPIFDAAGTNNNIGFEWGTSNPALSLLKNVMSNNEQSYHIPREGSVKPPSVSFSSIDIGTVSLAYLGGVLAPNGKVYLIPGAATRVLEIDVLSKTYTSIGTTYSTTANKWIGGTLAPNGKIYCAPFLASEGILEIDPDSKVTNTYITNGFSYRGAVCANNGKLYFISATTTSGDIIEFNPITKERVYFGNVGSTTFYGGVLAPNGKIYTIPYSTNQFGIINPDNKTIEVFSSASTGATNSICSGGVLAPNGKIYCVPFNADAILVINTLNNTTYTFGNSIVGASPLGSNSKCSGGFLGPDGYIYTINNSANTNGFAYTLRINWVYDTVEMIELPPPLLPSTISLAFSGGVLTPYGIGVACPSSMDKILFYNFNLPVNENVCLSNIVNTF